MPGRTNRHALVFALPIVLGAVIYAPRFAGTFVYEDVEVLLKVEGAPRAPYRGPLAAYHFQHPDRPSHLEATVQGNPWHAWWESPTLRFYQFRPLTSLTLWMDSRIWGRSFAGFTLTSGLLWLALLAAVVMTYRSFCRPPRPGATATVVVAASVYALASIHVWAIGWLTARSHVISILFTSIALVPYARWRRSGRRDALALAVLAFVLALLGGETGAVGFLWLASYEVCLGTGRAGARLRAIAPIALTFAAYVVVYQAAKFGVVGSLAYATPLGQAQAYFANLLPRAGNYLAADLGIRLGHPSLIADWIAVAGFAALVAGIVRRDPVARFMALGTAASTAFAAMSWNDHNIISASLGVAWLTAAYLVSAVGRVAGAFRAPGALRGRRAVAVHLEAALIIGLLGLRFGVEPYRSVRDMRAMNEESLAWRRGALSAAFPKGTETAGARVILLNGLDSYHGVMIPFYRDVFGDPSWPDAVWSLGSDTPVARLQLMREAESEFSLEAEGGPLAEFPSGVECCRDRPFVVGERRRVGAMDTVISAVDRGSATRLRVRIDRALDDPKVWLLFWDGAAYVRVSPPAVGRGYILRPGSGA